jgi:D-serine deaminase-like pyridoxal phosphate-dependent protein
MATVASKSPTGREHRPSYNYYKKALAGRQLPCGFVDVDLFDANVRDIVARASRGKTIRIATKSVRCTWALRRILEANRIFQGFMAYHPMEAAWLASQGLDDILIGYPFCREIEIEAVCRQVKAGKTIIQMIDHPDHVTRIAAVSKREGVVAPICVDVDMSSEFPGVYFGVRRSALRAPQDFTPIVAAVKANPSVELRGLMGYEAQIAGLQDKPPGGGVQNMLIPTLKKKSILELRARRKAAVETIRAAGITLPLVNGGGTGSVESTCEEDVVTEVTVGSGFFSPTLFDHYAQFRHHPAAGFAIEVVRRPQPGMVTCAGGGYVASGQAGKGKLPQPYLPEGAKLLDQEGAGEVQTPIVYDGPEKLDLGDPVLMRHAKAGEVCERFNTMLLIANGEVVDEVPTYRGEGQCFL